MGASPGVRAPRGEWLDRANPLLRRLAFLAAPSLTQGNLRDLVSAQGPSYFGSGQSWGRTKVGPCIQTTSSGSVSYPLTAAFKGLVVDDFTILAIADPNSYGSDAHVISVVYSPGSEVSPFLVFCIRASAFGEFCGDPGGSFTNVLAGAGWVSSSDLTLTHWAVTRSGSTLQAYKNGAAFGSSVTFSGSLSYGGSTDKLELGGYRDSGTAGREVAGDYPLAAVWGRALGAAELRALYDDPALLVRSRLFAVPRALPAAGSGATVNAGVGVLTLSGPAPVVTGGARVAPGVGALSLSGLAPAASGGALVSPAVGSLTLGGLAPAATGGARVAAGVGTVVLNGLAPSVNPPLAILHPAERYRAAGQASRARAAGQATGGKHAGRPGAEYDVP